MVSEKGDQLPQSRLGLASCAAFGLAVFLMIALNAMLGNLALHQGKVETYDSAVKPAFVSAAFTLYVDVPITLLGIGLGAAGLLRSNRARSASWIGLVTSAICLSTLLACYGIISWMTGIK